MHRIHLFLLALLTAAPLLFSPSPSWSATQPLQVLVSTFSIYQISRNITQKVEGIGLELMLPAALGCPHDYVLTPRDMDKLAKADLLIINGLGMEEFLEAPLSKANPRLRVIDSSRGISDILQQEGEHRHDHDEARHGQDEHPHAHAHQSAPNPHLFASPRMAAQLAENIATALAEQLPAAAPVLLANGRAYSRQLRQLADTMAETGKHLANNRIVTQHGVFDYLARDMGLEVVAVVQAHAGQNPSASELLALVNTIKARKAGAIFTEPQYPEALGRTMAREAGITAASLDPVATGPEQAPLNYYEQVMRANLDILEQTLGRR
ncbi:metal ABC transporter solute-binding protein, Zn/Mn family [Desulfobulbus propionicus]|jgi:ABC-type Zn uptake system ZnuABC Zn-binding protein ZnuA